MIGQAISVEHCVGSHEWQLVKLSLIFSGHRQDDPALWLSLDAMGQQVILIPIYVCCCCCSVLCWCWCYRCCCSIKSGR